MDSLNEIYLTLEDKEDKEVVIAKFPKTSEIHFNLQEDVTGRLDEL